MQKESVNSALASLGFTRYESEVYNALVELGEATARDISNHCPVPREKIYYVLRRMERQGLVRLVNKNPIRYIALPPKRTLQGKLDRMRDQVSRIENAVGILEERYTRGKVKIERKTMNFWEISQNPGNTLTEVLESCRESLKGLMTVESSVELVERHYGLLKKLYKNDVRMRFCAPLRDLNVRALGMLSNVADIEVIPTGGPEFSIFVADDEAGFIQGVGAGGAMHFIEPGVASLASSVIGMARGDSLRFEDMLTLLSQGEDPWVITSGLGKGAFFDLVSRAYSSLTVQMANGGDPGVASWMGHALLRELERVVRIAGLPLEQAVERIAAIGSMVGDYSAKVSFDESSKVLTFEVGDDLGLVGEAVEAGVTFPPDMWSLMIQEAIKAKGLREEITTIVYDKALGFWSFLKKYGPDGQPMAA